MRWPDWFGRRARAELKDAWAEIEFLRMKFFEHRATVDEIRSEQQALARGIARILIKVDPDYAKDPHSKETMAESNAIGDEVIRRLVGEIKATGQHK